jgi:hypothetical protein
MILQKHVGSIHDDLMYRKEQGYYVPDDTEQSDPVYPDEH